MPVFAYALAQVIKTMICAFVCIGACIGLFWGFKLYLSVLGCIGIVLVNVLVSVLQHIEKILFIFGLHLHVSLFHTYLIPQNKT